MEASVSDHLRQLQQQMGELTAAVLRHDPRQRLGRMRERLTLGRTRLDRSLERTLRRADARLSALDARLRSLSPLGVLERGYALILHADGGVIRSTAQIATGDLVTTRLSDGEFTSRVEETARKRRSKK